MAMMTNMPMRSGARFAPAVLGLALLPFLLNFRAASRAHGPDSTLARDSMHYEANWRAALALIALFVSQIPGLS